MKITTVNNWVQILNEPVETKPKDEWASTISLTVLKTCKLIWKSGEEVNALVHPTTVVFKSESLMFIKEDSIIAIF